MINQRIKEIIEEGINFIEEEQESDGSFYNLSSSNQDSFEKARQNYKTPFFTALILSCLNNIESSLRNSVLQRNNPRSSASYSCLPLFKGDQGGLKKIRKSAYTFLLSQKNEHWSYNYWTRGGQGEKVFPYPDDLDDTFCAYSAMSGYNPELFDGDAWAKIVELLTATEKKEGGPYKTWLVDSKASEAWQDVDLGVNANIANFLSMQEIELDGLSKYINKSVKDLDFNSSYYIPVYPVVYFISRFYQGPEKESFVKYILRKKNPKHNWGNPLKTALAISTLLNLGFPAKKLEKNIEWLVNYQKDGKYEPYTIGWDPGPNRQKLFAGASSVTTAFVIEALAKYSSVVEDIKQKRSLVEKKKSQKNYVEDVLVQVKKRFDLLPGRLGHEANNQLNEILSVDQGGNTHQIILLSYLFRRGLRREYQDKIDKEFLMQLSMANLYGWIAYTIYDDFYDNEAQIRHLPVANICLRELTKVFEKLLAIPEQGSPEGILDIKDMLPCLMTTKNFLKTFHKIMDDLDHENYREVTQGRLKIQNDVLSLPMRLPTLGRNYERLYKKSLGHALGPIAILYKLGFDEDSSEFQMTQDYFKYYIIVRQLNDDAHDWEKDLSNGFITSAVRELLVDYKKEKRSKSRIDLKKEMDDLRVIFWQKTIVRLCEDVLRYCEKAKDVLRQNDIFINTIVFEKMVEKMEGAANLALKERDESLKFLGAYK